MNTLLLKAPSDWGKVTSSLLALSRNKAREVRYINDAVDLSSDAGTIDVLVMGLKGQADYALDVYGKSLIELPNDTVGMHVALSTGEPVLVPDESIAPSCWLVLSPDGSVESVILDIEALNERSEVRYRRAERA